MCAVVFRRFEDGCYEDNDHGSIYHFPNADKSTAGSKALNLQGNMAYDHENR